MSGDNTTDLVVTLVPYILMFLVAAFLAAIEYSMFSLDLGIHKARINREIARERKAYDKQRSEYAEALSKQRSKEEKAQKSKAPRGPKTKA